MESVYGVGVTNRYALFLSEEDPLEKLKAKEKAKEDKKKKQASGAEKENSGVKTPPVKKQAVKPPVANGIKDNQNVKTDIKPREDAPPKPKKVEKKSDSPKDIETENSAPARKEPTQGQFDSNAGENKGERRVYNGEREREPRYREDGERYRGGMGGRPPRGGRGGGRGGRGGSRRDFDRQSGSDKTGIKPTSKRNGAGPHNWGTAGDEINEQMGATSANDSSGEWGNQDGKASDVVPNESATEKTEAAPASTEPEPEEVKEITLDEWKASRGTKLLKPQYNLRKAGEGEDLSQWGGMYELKKKEEAALAEKEKNQEAAGGLAVGGKGPKRKEIVDTNFHFADQAMRGGRGKRGGRGGERGERSFRGGGERGARDKGGYPRAPRTAPRVDVTSEQDFPSLG